MKKQLNIDYFSLLKRIPLFSVLSDAELEVLAKATIKRSFPKNSLVFSEGEPTQSLYIILSGRVKIQHADLEGSEVILAILGRGEFFGEMGVIDGSVRSATAITLDESDFLTINKDHFQACMLQNPNMALEIMRGLAARVRESNRQIESLALLDVYGRVARVLLDHSEDLNGQKILRDKLRRQDVAKMIGASREMVSRVVKDLEAAGFITAQGDGTFLIQPHRGPQL